MPLKKLAPFVCSLALAGCETPTALTKTGALEAFKPIPNSSHAPCQMQRAVAEHNAVYDTLASGKAVAYRAPCDIDKPAPKTS